MKKLKAVFSFALCLVACFSAFGITAFAGEDYFSAEQKEYYKNLGLQGTVINVYNWGEYISDGGEGSMDVVSEFEGLQVQRLITQTSNLTKICIQSFLGAVCPMMLLFRPTIWWNG